jgi:hypothetical protein
VLLDEHESKPPCLPGKTRYQATARLQRERLEAREAAQKAGRRHVIADGRCRSGPHKDSNRCQADRIDGYDRDDLGENPDF